MKARASWTNNKPFDLNHILDGTSVGWITDEHASSSYGLPVLVDEEDGQVYGVGDILEGSTINVYLRTGPYPRLFEAVAAAGYQARFIVDSETGLAEAKNLD